MLKAFPLAVATALTLAAPAFAAAALWEGRAGGGSVKLTAGDLVLPGYSARAAFMKELDPKRPKTEQHHASWKLLSVVGPYVSVEEHVDGFATGAAHPYDVGLFVARDASRKGAPASLDQLFPPAAIHRALMSDGLIKKALQGAKPATLPALLKALDGYQSDDCRWGITASDLLTRFAFNHVRDGQVAVRLGLSHGCEVARGGITVIGIYLPITEALVPALAAAQSGKEGFLQERAPKGVAQVYVGKP